MDVSGIPRMKTGQMLIMISDVYGHRKTYQKDEDYGEDFAMLWFPFVNSFV